MFCCCASEPEPAFVVDLTAESVLGLAAPNLGAAKGKQLAALAEPSGSVDFFVSIQKSPDSSLGLELDLMDDVNAQVCGIDAGLVQSYNETAQPDVQVRVGDFITAVNGFSGDARKLLQRLKSEPAATLHVRRPGEAALSVERGGLMLGLDLQKAPGGCSLLIHDIREGAVQNFNAANPHRELKRGDRIVAVNGCRGSTAAMMKAIKEPRQALSLSVVRP